MLSSISSGIICAESISVQQLLLTRDCELFTKPVDPGFLVRVAMAFSNATTLDFSSKTSFLSEATWILVLLPRPSAVLVCACMVSTVRLMARISTFRPLMSSAKVLPSLLALTTSLCFTSTFLSKAMSS